MAIGGAGPSEGGEAFPRIGEKRRRGQGSDIQGRSFDWEREAEKIEGLSQEPLTVSKMAEIRKCIQTCVEQAEEGFSTPKRVTRLQEKRLETKDETLKRVHKAAELILMETLKTDFSDLKSAEAHDLAKSVDCLLEIAKDKKSEVLQDVQNAKKLLKNTPNAFEYFDEDLLKLDEDALLLHEMLNNPASITQEKFDQLNDKNSEILRRVFLKQPTLFRFLDPFLDIPFTRQVLKDNPLIIQYVGECSEETLVKIIVPVPETFEHLEKDKKYSQKFCDTLVDCRAHLVKSGQGFLSDDGYDLFEQRDTEQRLHGMKSLYKMIVEVFDNLDVITKDDCKFVSQVISQAPEVFSHLSDIQKYKKELVLSLLSSSEDIRIQKIVVEIFDHLDQTIRDDYEFVSEVISYVPEVFLHLSPEKKYKKELVLSLLNEYLRPRLDSRIVKATKNDERKIFNEIYEHLLSLDQHDITFMSQVLVKDPDFYFTLSETQKSNKELQKIFLKNVSENLNEDFDDAINDDLEKIVSEIAEHLDPKDTEMVVDFLNIVGKKFPNLSTKAQELAWKAFESGDERPWQYLIRHANYETKGEYADSFLGNNFLRGIEILGETEFDFECVKNRDVKQANPFVEVALKNGFREIAILISAFTYPYIDETGTTLLSSLSQEVLTDLLFRTKNGFLRELLTEDPSLLKETLDNRARELMTKSSSIQEREALFDAALAIFSIPKEKRTVGQSLLKPLPNPKEPSQYSPLMDEVEKISNDQEGKPLLDKYLNETMKSIEYFTYELNHYVDCVQNIPEASEKLQKIISPDLSTLEKWDEIQAFMKYCEENIGPFDELPLLDELYKNETGKKLIDAYCMQNNKDFQSIRKDLSLFCQKANDATKGLVGGNKEFFNKARRKLRQLTAHLKEQNDPDATWYAIKDFVEASGHCIGAYDDAIRTHYDKARRPERELSPTELLEVEIAKMREDFLLAAAKEQNPNVDEVMEVHQHTQAFLDLGEELGIIGSGEEKHKDRFVPKGYNKDEIRAIFNKYYTPGKVIRKFIDKIRESSSLRRDCFYRMIADLEDPGCKDMRDSAYQELEKWQRGEANDLIGQLKLYGLEEKKALLDQPPDESLVKTLRDEIAFGIWQEVHRDEYEQDGQLKLNQDFLFNFLFNMRDLFQELGIIAYPKKDVVMKDVT